MTINRFIALFCILSITVHVGILRLIMWDGTLLNAFGAFTAFIFLLFSIYFIWKGSK